VEVAEPELEQMARRAKRAVWAFRLIFYPGAAIIALLLLTSRGAAADPPVPLVGHTGQGEKLTFMLDDDHRPDVFYTRLTATCPDTGWQYTLLWHRVDGDRIAFDKDTGKMSAVYTFQGRWSDGVPANAEARMNGHLDDDRVTGTLRFIDHRDGFECDSGAVSFSAD
jgi:hypothetical protein